MQKIEILSAQHQFGMSLGKLVKHQRAQRMAQGELATRTGLAILSDWVWEKGMSSASMALFHVYRFQILLHTIFNSKKCILSQVLLTL